MASSASTSLVASTPVGGMPASSPASRPALSAACTQVPTSSRSGWPTMPAMAFTPMRPVAHWITRYVMASPLDHPRLNEFAKNIYHHRRGGHEPYVLQVL